MLFRSVRMHLEAPAVLPDVSVDRLLLHRALTNIVENALHAMPSGGTLSIALALERGEMRIALTDTGIGMDAEAVSRLFEPYFSTKATGTGLGLTIAKRNVELHGGRIEVSSQREVGTRVTIWLPLSEAGRGGGDAGEGPHG